MRSLLDERTPIDVAVPASDEAAPRNVGDRIEQLRRRQVQSVKRVKESERL